MPTVAFMGPSELGSGQSATFAFRVKAGSGLQHAAGFNVAAQVGTLAVIAQQGERLSGDELTHSTPKGNDGSGVATWQFTWTAPAAPGIYRLFGAGNSVNLNGQPTGDRSDTTTFDVIVGGGSGTPTPTPSATAIAPTATPTITATPSATRTATKPSATTTQSSTRTASTTTTVSPNPTQTLSPAATATSSHTTTPTATTVLPTPAATATTPLSTTPTVTPPPGTCAGDCDGDGTVGINELIAAVGIALSGQPPDACPSLDLDHDGVVAINELLTAVNGALLGC